MELPSSPGHAAASRLVPLAALLIIMAVAALGSLAITAFTQAVQPELDKRSRLIGTGIRNSIEHALSLGVPLDQMNGAEHYLLSVMNSFPEVSRITIRTVEGIPVTEVERRFDGAVGVIPSASLGIETYDARRLITENLFRFAILSGNTLKGEVLIKVDPSYLKQQFTDVFMDVLVIVLVVLLLAFEIMLAAVTTSLGKPLDGLYRLLERQGDGDFSQRIRFPARSVITHTATRFSDHAVDLHNRYTALSRNIESDPQASRRSGVLDDIGRRFGLSVTAPVYVELKNAVDMRLPLFLFATGEELSKSFLPLLVRNAAAETAWLKPEILISLPLIAYLLGLIVLSPLAGGLAERYTARKVFLYALLPVAISHIGLSVSTSVVEFTLWRGVAGAGYALATIACQEYALRTSTDGRHGRAMGGFVMVVIGGTFCGTAVGGVLADRLGASITFLFGAVLVAVSAGVAYRMMAGDTAGRVAQASPLPLAPRSVFANPRFIGLLFGVAIPANIMMAAFLWYVVPLALSDLGARPAVIGRVLMIYYLMTILAAPVAARFVDHSAGTPFLLASGGAISGIALICLTAWYGFWPIAAAVAAAGVGHAIIRATLVPLTITIAASGARPTASGKALGALRMWERAGSVIGLAATGLFVGRYGYASTAGAIGLLTVTGTLVFLAIDIIAARHPDG